MRDPLKQIHCRSRTLNGPSLRFIESRDGNHSGGAVRLQP